MMLALNFTARLLRHRQSDLDIIKAEMQTT